MSLAQLRHEPNWSLPCALLRIGANEQEGRDRVALYSWGKAIVAVIADGAGGTSGGAAAADAVIETVEQTLLSQQIDPFSPADWCALLASLDQRLSGGGGETTAVVAALDEHRIAGASVGDSGAWLLPAGGADYEDLTAHQHRRPLVGSGAALPIPFESQRGGGTLLLATDGLLHYASPQAICRIAAGRDLRVASELLVRLVRLRSGALADDVGLVLCRREQSPARPVDGPQQGQSDHREVASSKPASYGSGPHI